jgi:hypothetical protein
MVKLVQFLCPQRHALLASAYEEGVGDFVGACNFLETMVGPDGSYKRQCMICGSRDLHFEEQTLPFKSLQEAAPYLMARQRMNIYARRMLDGQGKTLEPIDRDPAGTDKLGCRVAPGIWVDANGDTHYSIPELLQLVGLPDTPEHRAKVKQMIQGLFQQNAPGVELRFRERPGQG